MRDRHLYALLVFSLVFFETSMILFMIALFYLLEVSGMINGIALFMLFPIIFGGAFYYILLEEVYNESNMVNGETHQIYKANKQIKKLELKKQFLENKQKHDSKVQELKNKIKQIKNEMNPFEEGSFFHAKKNDKFSKSVKLCLTCKSLNHSEAMYCSQCGSVKFSNIIY